MRQIINDFRGVCIIQIIQSIFIIVSSFTVGYENLIQGVINPLIGGIMLFLSSIVLIKPYKNTILLMATIMFFAFIYRFCLYIMTNTLTEVGFPLLSYTALMCLVCSQEYKKHKRIEFTEKQFYYHYDKKEKL